MKCSRPPLNLESRHAEASAPRARLSRRVSSGLLSLQRVLEAFAHWSTRKLYALKWKCHFMVRRSPARPSQLPDWYSSGVLAGPFLRRVTPLHPEGLRGGVIGLPRPSWWLVSGRTPPCYTFPPEAEASGQKRAMLCGGSGCYSIASSPLISPLLGGQDSLLRSWPSGRRPRPL